MFLPRSQKVLAAFSDERLVEQVRRGNEDAFEAIYDRHHRGILAFCRHMLASPDEAEDAVQQTFISAYDALLSDGRDIRLKAWLYTIARNRCLSILRARREQHSDVDVVPVAGLSDQVQQRADLRDLLVDVQGLPVDQRAALVLSELGDLSHAEVGAIVGCEVAKVKSLVFQARSSLIESKRAREIPCQEIREQLATASGGALRRGPLRKHLRACSGCAEFRDDVMRQRKALAAVLPVLPTLGLKKAALSALGMGGGGAGGAAVGGGVIASLAGGGTALKLTAIAVVAGVAVGGGLVLDRQSKPPAAEASGGKSAVGGQAWPAPVTVTGRGGHLTVARMSHVSANPVARHHSAARHAKRHAPHGVARHHAAVLPAPSAGSGTKQSSPPRRHASASMPPRTTSGHPQHATGHHHMTAHHPSPPPPPAPAPPPPAPAPAPSPSPTATTSTPHGHGHHYGWYHHHAEGLGGPHHDDGHHYGQEGDHHHHD